MAVILYFYSSSISAVFGTSNGPVEYKLIKTPITPSQDYQTNVTVGELTNNVALGSTPDTGMSITIKANVNMKNATSSDGWASSYLLLKPIIKIGDSPQLYYNAKDSKAVVLVAYRDNPTYPHIEQIELDLPQQKDTEIKVSISNRDIKISIDGALVKFHKLPNVALITAGFSDIIQIGESSNNIQGTINSLSIFF